MGAPLVEIENVHKSFAALQDSAAPEVLRGVDLAIEEGESIAIVGPSGCGKSTLLNIVGALMPPSAGTVRFEGSDLAQLDADELAVLRNTKIGFVFQLHHLLPQLTALENVLVPTLVHRDPAHRRSAPDRARRLLADVGLGGRLAHRPAQLSGGECQRVAVVRALVNQPRLLLADEPTGSLDRRASEQLIELLCELNGRERVALVTVTHSAALAARMQHVFELADGVLALQDVPA